MSIKYFTESNYVLFRSLERFTRFLLNYNLEDVNKCDALYVTQLIILEEEKDNPKLWEILSGNSNISAISLGFEESCTLKIFPILDLLQKFSEISLNNNTVYEPLFSQKEVKERVKRFFHSHGEQSVIDKLNWVKYYFRNGPPQLILKEISDEEYISSFYKIGNQYWEGLKERLIQYSIFFQMLDKSREFITIKELSFSFDSYIQILSNAEKVKSELNLKKNENIVEILDKIDEILTKINSEIIIDSTGT